MENIRAPWEARLRKWIVLSWGLAAAVMLAAAAFGYQAEAALGGAATVQKIDAASIFRNNAAMLGSNLLGVLTLGLTNLASGLLNGYAMGSAACISIHQFGWGWMLKSFLPHGILEIPVILLSVSMGAAPWMLLAQRVKYGRGDTGKMAQALGKYLMATVCVCLLALGLAAVIEANISMAG